MYYLRIEKHYVIELLYLVEFEVNINRNLVGIEGQQESGFRMMVCKYIWSS